MQNKTNEKTPYVEGAIINESAFRHGFTLTEILIALAVIGVAAAMTIPVIIQNVGDQGVKAAWKNNYSILSQATQNIMANSPTGNMMSAIGTSSNITLKDNYALSLTTNKQCDGTNILTAGNCWSSTWYKYDGTAASATGVPTTSLVLTNGSFVAFFSPTSATNCAGDSKTGWLSLSSTTVPWATNSCGDIYVDVNGFAGPNRIGRDIYAAHILKDGLKAAGSTVTSISDGYDTCSATGDGFGCSLSNLSN